MFISSFFSLLILCWWQTDDKSWPTLLANNIGQQKLSNFFMTDKRFFVGQLLVCTCVTKMEDSSEDEAVITLLMLTRLRKKKKRNRTVWVRPWILQRYLKIWLFQKISGTYRYFLYVLINQRRYLAWKEHNIMKTIKLNGLTYPVY